MPVLSDALIIVIIIVITMMTINNDNNNDTDNFFLFIPKACQQAVGTVACVHEIPPEVIINKDNS